MKPNGRIGVAASLALAGDSLREVDMWFWIVGLLAAMAAPPTTVNGAPLTPHQAQALQRIGVTAQPGAWWYDPRSGLFGPIGSAAAGVLPAGLPFSAVRPRASRGSTGVFVNGRQIPPDEWVIYSRLVGQPVAQGHYWLDGQGNVGYAGQPRPVANLYALARSTMGSPADRWLSGGEWSGSLSSGTVSPTGPRDSVFSVDGEVLTLP